MKIQCTLPCLSAAVLLAAGAAVSVLTAPTTASSHSDAPLIKQDPQANLTDVYAFVGTRYDNANEQVLNIIVHVRPFSEPGDGPHHERFAPDALYSIHVTDPSSGETQLRYDFRFSGVDEGYKNPDTILSYGLGTAAGPILLIGDAQQNYTQTYTVSRTAGQTSAVITSGAPVAPPNAGNNVTPLYNDANGKAVSGAASFASLDSYTRQAVTASTNGEVVFAGPRDDGFYADVPGVFDLLNVRILDNNGTLEDGLGQDGGGVDGFKGFNVLSFAIQIPLSDLPTGVYEDAFFGQQTGVGVYASVSRPKVTLRKAGNNVENYGDWIQVNRLGNPLFNEVLVAFKDKDRYNATAPTEDSQYGTYAANPEVAALINLVYGTAFVTQDRQDLVNIFVPDVLRVATTTGPVTLDGQPGFSRFGFVGGDTTGGVSSGWPNGRRLGDDVVDIALTAVASGPTYASITVVGDNVPGNDAVYNRVFPYSATPHSATNNRKDPAPGDFEIADVNGDGVINYFDVLGFLKAYNNAF